MCYPPHVHKLPNELLAKVFVSFAPDSPDWYWQSLQPIISLDLLGIIMLVCRHWREVALSTVDLWRVMDIGARSFTASDGNSPAYLERVERAARYFDLILPRTAEAPLEIRFGDAEVAAYILPNILATLAYRLHQVVVELPRGASQFPDLIRLLADTKFLILDELRVESNHSRKGHPPIEDRVHCLNPALTLKRFPALRTLFQESVVIYETSVPLLSRITNLYLDSCSFNFDSPQPLNRFIEVLGGCKNLMELRLLEVLTSHNLPPKGSAPRVAKLEKLISLYLSEELEYASWFMCSISINNSANLNITGLVYEFEPYADMDLFASLYPASMAAHLKTVTYGNIGTSNGDALEGMTAGIPNAYFSLGGGEFGVHPTLEFSLRAFSRIFAGAPITKVSITGAEFGDLSRGSDSQIWVNFFSQFPDIKELELGYCKGSLVGLFAALGLPLQTQADCDSQASMPVYPMLESITATGPGLEWETSGMVESFAAMLRRRSALGLPKWKRLDF